MATFVLVHGAWHGSWCWERVVPALEERGDKVVAVDLPGRPANPLPHDQITLDKQTDYLVDVINSQGEPVVLVGHSLGGVAITEAAERVPDRVAALVFVAACLLPNGKGTMDIMPADNAALFVPSEDGLMAGLGRDAIPLLYGCCTQEDGEWAYGHLCEEAFAVNVPVKTTDERFGTVPRVYVETLQDRILPIEVQRSMMDEVSCEKVFSLNTDHSPELSRPGELVDILHVVGEDYPAK